MFQFRRFPSYAYLIQRRMTEYCSAGFPHSVIPGSTDMCSSPRLIAACHDLHRLLMPRHSPCALISLTFGGTLKCRIWFSFRIMQIITEKFNSASNCFTQLLELPQFLASLASSVACSYILHLRCSVFKVQTFWPLLQGQIEMFELTLKHFDPILFIGSPPSTTGLSHPVGQGGIGPMGRI